MRSDDIAPLLGGGFTTQLGKAATSGELGFHQGLVLAWNAATGHNQISIAGSVVDDVPVLTSAGIVSLRPGDPVGVLRYKSIYFIVGRTVAADSRLAEPQFPIVLYPQFQPNIAIDTGGAHNVSAGKLVSWEGRIKVSHPKIEVDGLWGVLSGTGTVTYTLRLDADTDIGKWTLTNSLVVDRASILATGDPGATGFDVSGFLGQDWLRIELLITASSGTGQIAFQPLGVYFKS